MFSSVLQRACGGQRSSREGPPRAVRHLSREEEPSLPYEKRAGLISSRCSAACLCYNESGGHRNGSNHCAIRRARHCCCLRSTARGPHAACCSRTVTACSQPPFFMCCPPSAAKTNCCPPSGGTGSDSPQKQRAECNRSRVPPAKLRKIWRHHSSLARPASSDTSPRRSMPPSLRPPPSGPFTAENTQLWVSEL
ncbi:hypothetical protein MTO96_013636 [Rhipicephalus appendiculatus]